MIAGPVIANPLIDGAACGALLRIDRPFSLWGGIDPASGRITDAGSGYAGTAVAGRVLALTETRGSSSSSAVLLELLASGRAPAAIILGRIDAIVGLGIVVAREMGWPTIPLLVLAPDALGRLPQGAMVTIAPGGRVSV